MDVLSRLSLTKTADMILAVTRSPLPWNDGPVIRRSSGPWHVLAVADDAFTRLKESPDSVVLSRSPFAALGRHEDGLGISASFDTSAREVVLRSSLSAGTSLYYTVTAAGDLLCATRVRGLQKLGVTLDEDRTRLPELFVYCFVCAPATLFRNISRMTMDET